MFIHFPKFHVHAHLIPQTLFCTRTVQLRHAFLPAPCDGNEESSYAVSGILEKHQEPLSLPTLSSIRTPWMKRHSESWNILISSCKSFSALQSPFWHVPTSAPPRSVGFKALLHFGHANAEKHSLLFSISSSLENNEKVFEIQMYCSHDL